MPRRFIRMPYTLTCLLALGVIVLSTCKGSTGPPGLLTSGTVTGKIDVWEDAVSNSQNPVFAASIPAGGFTVTLVGDSTKSVTTGPDGSYAIPDVPAGTYIIEVSKQPDLPIGYGTMKRFNFFVGGGTSNHSGDIGRKAPKPDAVSASVDSVAGTSGANIAGTRVAWSFTPLSQLFSTYVYRISFRSPTIGASVDVVGSGALSDTTIVVGLPPETYNVSVQADIGLRYEDESSGEVVFPARSDETSAPNSVILSRPTVIDLSPKAIAREFPGQRVVPAKIDE